MKNTFFKDDLAVLKQLDSLKTIVPHTNFRNRLENLLIPSLTDDRKFKILPLFSFRTALLGLIMFFFLIAQAVAVSAQAQKGEFFYPLRLAVEGMKKQAAKIPVLKLLIKDNDSGRDSPSTGSGQGPIISSAPPVYKESNDEENEDNNEIILEIEIPGGNAKNDKENDEESDLQPSIGPITPTVTIPLELESNNPDLPVLLNIGGVNLDLKLKLGL